MSTSSTHDACSSRIFFARLAGAVATLVLLAWLSSGTLAPYAATSRLSGTWTSCQYLVNCDHPQFLATFRMLEGAPRAEWEFSVVLRRLLQPLLAFPLMKAFGFEIGGLLFNLLANVTALLGFAAFVRRRVGERGAVAVAWLLATWPGLHFWVTMPYSYGAIVPACLGAAAILWRLDELPASATKELALLALLLGLLFTAYDLVQFFAPAFAAVAWLRFRRFGPLAVGVMLLLLPSIADGLVMRYGFHVSLLNSNTEAYSHIVQSWLHPGQWPAWRGLLAASPWILVQNFFASSYWGLPTLFLILVARARSRGDVHFASWEVAVLACMFGIWAMNNLGPPYPGWQLRGTWIARLYQPAFVVLLSFVARSVEVAFRDDSSSSRRWVAGAVAATALLGVSVVLGPWVSPGYAVRFHLSFYRHDVPGTFAEQLRIYGKRPLGVCR